MGLFDGMRSRLSGQTKEEFGLGQRFPLSKPLEKELRRHLVTLGRRDLSQYTFERRRSSYPHAKSDIVVYDDKEQPVADGREMSSGEISFWTR